VLPGATLVLDWWHAAVRFEHALQAARSLGAGTADARLADTAVRGLERAKGRLWHGHWPGCRRKLAALCRWMQRRPMRDMVGADKVRRHVAGLLGYLGRNEAALVPYAARRRRGEPIATSFVESAVDEIHRLAHEQDPADALEPGHRAALPRRAHRRAERHARGRLQPALCGLPAGER